MDTARKYGLSERRVGDVMDWERACVFTKVDDLDTQWCESLGEQATRLAVDASIFRSCRELHCRELPVVLAGHTLDNYKNQVIWGRLLELQADGVIGKLGVSIANPTECLEALQDPNVQHVQIPFNILDWRWRTGEVQKRLAERGDVTVHARSIFLQGLLISGSETYPTVDGADGEKIVQTLEDFTAKYNLPSRKHLVLAYILADRNNWINCFLTGVATIEQLQENLDDFRSCEALTEEQCVELDEAIGNLPEQFLNPHLWPKKKVFIDANVRGPMDGKPDQVSPSTSPQLSPAAAP